MLPNCIQKFNEIQHLVYELNDNIYQANILLLLAIENNNSELFDEARKILKNSDKLGNQVDNQIIKAFALFGPEAVQLRQLVSYLKIVNELVSISEYIKKYSKEIKKILIYNTIDDIKDYLIQIHKCNHKIFDVLNISIQNIYKDEFDLDMKYSIIITEDSKIEDFYDILEKELLQKSDNIYYSDLLKILRRLEKSSNRGVTIARLLLFIKDGGVIKNY